MATLPETETETETATVDETVNCEGCGTELVLVPFVARICPNKECTYEHDLMFAHLSENTGKSRPE